MALSCTRSPQQSADICIETIPVFAEKAQCAKKVCDRPDDIDESLLKTDRRSKNTFRKADLEPRLCAFRQRRIIGIQRCGHLRFWIACVANAHDLDQEIEAWQIRITIRINIISSINMY